MDRHRFRFGKPADGNIKRICYVMQSRDNPKGNALFYFTEIANREIRGLGQLLQCETARLMRLADHRPKTIGRAVSRNVLMKRHRPPHRYSLLFFACSPWRQPCNPACENFNANLHSKQSGITTFLHPEMCHVLRASREVRHQK
jgi:hypothetical protein